ncbi:hypothetical protein CEXT_86701 [Caerostris extrusa]|uniref:Uncharacterized protein n=1 Tax=Caerostris extrusa TaxID=172846 RepID=A0AAV4XDZ9_CAEEX|nr:hypothetical protein CEXT_86701 [Caerostris extrusa]
MTERRRLRGLTVLQLGLILEERMQICRTTILITTNYRHEIPGNFPTQVTICCRFRTQVAAAACVLIFALDKGQLSCVLNDWKTSFKGFSGAAVGLDPEDWMQIN